MTLLLDTCVFLHLLCEPARIPQDTLRELGRRPIHVSIVSFWEILLKHGRGRIEIDTGDRPLMTFLGEHARRIDAKVIPVLEEHLHPLEHLPPVHPDPFDRLLICQAIREGLVLVTPDAAIRRYPIRTLWD